MGSSEFPASTERPVISKLIENRKANQFCTVQTKLVARSLLSGFNKQKEEVHGDEFDRTFQRCRGQKLLGAVVVLGRFFFALIFLFAAPNHFTRQTIAF